MIVVDASAVIEWLLRTEVGNRVDTRLFSSPDTLHAPHLIDVEVAQVLRRYVIRGRLSPLRAGQAVQDLDDMALSRYPHTVLLQRIWELRDNLTAYDAAYVALAEALAAPLVTCDTKIASAPGHDASVDVI